jgi:membrane protein implicated in regulation of membrane protease activity
MKLRIIIPVFAIIFAVIFVAGMAIGYYLALSLMNKIALLALGAFGFAFVTWVGSGADLLGLLREWYKEKKEEEKIPVLEYDGNFRTRDHTEEIGGKTKTKKLFEST